MDDILVSCLLDGAIFIFIIDNEAIPRFLDDYIYNKNNEVYLELI